MEDGHEYYCSRDADGRCRECLERIVNPLKGIIEIYKEAHERIGREIARLSGVCEPCGKEHPDYAVAMFFSSILPGFDPAIRKQTASILVNYAMTQGGIAAMPLTEKALRDIEKADPAGAPE